VWRGLMNGPDHGRLVMLSKPLAVVMVDQLAVRVVQAKPPVLIDRQKQRSAHHNVINLQKLNVAIRKAGGLEETARTKSDAIVIHANAAARYRPGRAQYAVCG
jgi:hypothetical protein